MVSITICMGSSCFSRGNNRNLASVQAWLTANGREAEVALKGCRCGNKCAEGPNIWINGTCHSGVTPESVPELLAQAFTEESH